MLINRKLPEATASEASHMQLGVWGRCKHPKKKLRFGALRAVLRHYSRIINKTFLLNSFIFSPTKTYIGLIACISNHDNYNYDL